MVVGFEVGGVVGATVGDAVGVTVGDVVGAAVGDDVGAAVGDDLGATVGDILGKEVSLDVVAVILFLDFVSSVTLFLARTTSSRAVMQNATRVGQ